MASTSRFQVRDYFEHYIFTRHSNLSTLRQDFIKIFSFEENSSTIV